MVNPSELTLMAVHAHPDDESSSTGGVLALYGGQGIRTVLVTCTNGEYGDGPKHVKPGEDGHDPSAVAKTRLAELESATTHLGVSHVELLGYHDSGMPDWEFKEKPDVFCNVPLETSASRLVDLFEKYQPDVVVTYDDNGGYNHPDHLRAHQITMEAVRRTDIPDKLYLIARRRRDWEKMWERLREAGIELPNQPRRDVSPERARQMELTEARISTSVDTSSVAAQKRAALVAHASQLDESWWTRLPAETFPELFSTETFIRERDRTGASLPEDDLFAGLR